MDFPLKNDEIALTWAAKLSGMGIVFGLSVGAFFASLLEIALVQGEATSDHFIRCICLFDIQNIPFETFCSTVFVPIDRFGIHPEERLVGQSNTLPIAVSSDTPMAIGPLAFNLLGLPRCGSTLNSKSQEKEDTHFGLLKDIKIYFRQSTA